MTDAVEGSLSIPNTRAYLYSLRDRLPQFVITDHPADWPDFFVARLWLSLPEPAMSNLVIMDRDLERLQVTMEALGLTCLGRYADDNPLILQVWI